MTRSHWLLAAVVLAPLAVTPFGAAPTIMQAKNAFFVDMGLALAVWSVRSWWLRAGLIVAAIGFLTSGMRGWAFVGVLGMLAFAFVYQAASEMTRADWVRLRWVTAVAVGFQVLWMGMQALVLDPLFIPAIGPGHVPVYDGTIVTGWFSNASDTAAFFGLALPLLASLHAAVAVPVALVTVLVLHSTAGLIAVALTTLWFAWCRSGRLAAGVAGLGLLAAPFWIYVDAGVGNAFKVFIWRHSVFLFSFHPWIGWGPNAVEYRLLIDNPLTHERWNFLFNEWLQGGVELGIPILAVGVGFALLGLMRAWRYRVVAPELMAGVLVTLALVTMSNALRIGPCALLMALYLGRLDGLAQGVHGHG